MSVRIITGAIGSGKSRMCLNEIDIIHGKNPSARCIMIVPDHYSYETEKRFVERFGGTGLNNIEVLTLRRMAINTLTMSELNHLTDAGRQMLIYKAVNESVDELRDVEGMDIRLISSMQRCGFLDVAASLISEMKRYMVTPETLKEKADETDDNKTLKNKLTAFSSLYGRYMEYVEKSGASDGDDDLRVLARHIEEEDEYDDNTYVWIDRFDKFMPQQAAVVEALLKKGAHVTISVCYSEDDGTEKELYAETFPTLMAAHRLADEYGLEEQRAAGKALMHLMSKPDLYTLLKRWNEEYEYDTAPPNIKLFKARDTYSETERVACEICDLVRGEGARYRDMAIMCGDENEYIHLIEAIFAEYEIPYFTDRKIILSDHPIAMQILSLFRVLRENWSYESVMSYLRAGFIYKKIGRGVFPLDQNEIDTLENFILKCGIRGAKRWMSEDAWYYENDIISAAFGEEEATEAAEVIDNLRREIAAPVKKFADAVKGRREVKEIATALFEYLGDINLYAGLKFEISRFKKNGMVNEAEQFTKIWNLILDVLNQTAEALAGDCLTAEEYEEYMSVGLTKCEIRAIPSGIDQVYVGSAERMSNTNVKYIFVIGAKNGTFPTGVATEGFFSDRDRNTLAEKFGVRLAPDTRRKTDEQYFKVYRALCAVSKRLYLSYSVQDEEGRPLGASHMYLDIKRKFPKLKESDNLMQSPMDYVYISSPKATMHHLIFNLASKRKNAVWDEVYEWYNGKEEWQRQLGIIDRAGYYERCGVLLREDIANLLYSGHIDYSPTRLNAFSSCPFGYFMRYGLGAKEREEWAISPMSMGTYAHRVIHDFCAEVEKNATSDSEKIDAWRALSDDERNSLINNIIDVTCAKITAADSRDKEKTQSIFRRMGKTIRSSAALVHKCLSSGDFAELGMEKEFRTKLTENASLKGTIDRVDACLSKDGKTYLRVVDYKTGSTEFDVVNIANGYNMQMVIYALAMREELKNTDTEVTGVYYTAVRDEYTKLNKTTINEGNIKEVTRNSLCLDGVTFADEDEVSRMRTLYNIDHDIIERGESGFIGVKIDSDGTAGGVRSTDEINGLMESVRETVVDIDNRTRSGDIGLNPYEYNNDKCVCGFCSYASVCKFDEQKRVAREKKGDDTAVWDKMKVKGAAMRGVKTDGEVD